MATSGDAIRVETMEITRLAHEAGCPSEVAVLEFVRTLLAYLMRADGGMSGDELKLLATFNRDGFTWHEEIEAARDRVRSAPCFLHTVPDFVQAAIRHDWTDGTALTEPMIAAVERICAQVSHSDGVTTGGEGDVSRVMLATLRNAVWY